MNGSFIVWYGSSEIQVAITITDYEASIQKGNCITFIQESSKIHSSKHKYNLIMTQHTVSNFVIY
jgi:hypothetical protein